LPIFQILRCAKSPNHQILKFSNRSDPQILKSSDPQILTFSNPQIPVAIIYWRLNAAAATSGKSVKMPSTPSDANCSYSRLGSPPYDGDKNTASLLIVQTCTNSPAACASFTSEVGGIRRPSLSAGTIRRLLGPTPSAYFAI